MLAHQQLVGHVVAALSAAPAVAQVVTRRGSRAIADGINSAVRVRILASIAEPIALGGTSPIDWTAQLAIECMARTGASQAPDEAAGPLLLAVHARLMADTTLAAAGYQLLPEMQINPDEDELDERIGTAMLVLSVRWTSAYNTLDF